MSVLYTCWSIHVYTNVRYIVIREASNGNSFFRTTFQKGETYQRKDDATRTTTTARATRITKEKEDRNEKRFRFMARKEAFYF